MLPTTFYGNQKKTIDKLLGEFHVPKTKKKNNAPDWWHFTDAKKNLKKQRNCALGCPRKLGSMVSKWVITPIYHIYK